MKRKRKKGRKGKGSKLNDIARNRARRKRKRLVELRGRKCSKCTKDHTTIDHIIRIADGGSNDDANLDLLCEPCHIKKEQRYDQIKKFCKENCVPFVPYYEDLIKT